MLSPTRTLQTQPAADGTLRVFPRAVTWMHSRPHRTDGIEPGDGTPRLVTTSWRSRWLPSGLALRVAAGFAAVAIIVVAANLTTQQSARDAREKVRELRVQHEPMVQAADSLTVAVSAYQRAAEQSANGAGSEQATKLATQRMGDAGDAFRAAVASFPDPDADRAAISAAEAADRNLRWLGLATVLLIAIIGFATVIGVTAPVHRLSEATRRLAGGAVRTHALRGDVRELDTLAAAFNQMIDQVQQAQNAVKAHQLELEARVDERTRELKHLAHHDPLTDLPNRRHLLMHLDGAVGRARLGGRRAALLFIDLDNFKAINDSMGHAFGDRVLQAVGERLRMNSLCLRSFSARLGGDEFTIVCEEVGELGDVERLCRSVLEEFQRPLSVHGHELRIGVSVGACVFPDHASDSQALLSAADSALFDAKEQGRDGWSLYAPPVLEATASRIKIEQSLRRAVAHGEFELLYQPAVCFETLETYTVEALLRWRQPDGNVVSPADFFAVAEQTGLIADISDWALRNAIQTAAQWQRGPWPKARVAVNVSSQQLVSGSFVARLQSLLTQYQLPAHCLELELTEGILQAGANTMTTLQRLRELGVHIALDDFGTGHSSLTSLERLPLSRVKIDRSLVASIDTGGRAPAIVRSIVGLCHSLGLQVTAEGVERPAQLGLLLTDRGVQMQGYLLSRPIDAAAVPAFVEQARAHLEQLMIGSPTPVHEGASITTRLRTLRAAGAGRSRVGRLADEK